MGTQRQRRAQVACRFCRKRKYRCDGESPKCGNCQAHNEQCVYELLPQRERPSRAKVAQLESEVADLKNQLQKVEAGSERDFKDGARSTSTFSVAGDELEDDAVAALSNLKHQKSEPGAFVQSPPAIARIHTSAKGASLHGPTSTLFEGPQSSGGRQAPVVTLSQQEIESELFAEAAKQRQLEIVNFSEGRLDFDGISPDLGWHLLQIHWTRQHHSFLISYRPAFMRDMACNGPYFSKLLLNALYFGACKYCDRPELRGEEDYAVKFRTRFKELLTDALDRSSIPSAQALLLMSSALFGIGEEASAAWLYVGIGCRMVLDLGLNIDLSLLPPQRRPSPQDEEIRRRVFWGAYAIDKVHSLYQGRTASLQETEARVPLKFLDRYEELESWIPVHANPTRSQVEAPGHTVSTMVELSKLSIIMNRVLKRIYAEASALRKIEDAIQDKQILHKNLEDWIENLPDHLAWRRRPPPSTPPPHVLSLQALYNVLLILLHRPFVEGGHLAAPSVAAQSFRHCIHAANDIVRVIREYDQAFSIKGARYLISYATYVAATIHVRVAAQRDVNSNAYANLCVCLEMFRQNQKTNHAVQQAIKVITGLMERLGVQLPESHSLSNGNGETVQLQSTMPAQISEGQQYSNMSNYPGMSTEALYGNPNESSPELDMQFIINSFPRDHFSMAQMQAQQMPNAALAYQPQMEMYPTMAQYPADRVLQSQPDAQTVENWPAPGLGINGTYHDTLFGFGNEWSYG